MAEEERDITINCYIINSIPRPICNVKFQPLPFYRNVYKVLQPMAIYCVPTVKPSLKNPKEHTLFDFVFELPELVKRVINEKKSAQLQIRFGKELPGMSELSEGLPGEIQFSINSHKASVMNSPINYNCTTVLKSNNTKNEILITWPHCNEPYYMVVNIEESMTAEDMVKQVQYNNKVCSRTLNTKTKIKEFLKSVGPHTDIEPSDLLSRKLSLLCPITQLKMKLPTRSMKCNHLESFDLHALFSMNMTRPTWKCPVCNIPILVGELVIDSFFLDIINSSSLPENCFDIILYKNGNWEPYIEPKIEFIEGDQSEAD